MDRKLKERLIGLVVLLTAAVIIVPMILGDRESVPEDAAERPAADRDTREVRLDLAETGEREEVPEGDADAEPQAPEDVEVVDPQPEPDVLPEESEQEETADSDVQEEIAAAREELAREQEEAAREREDPPDEEPAEEDETAEDETAEDEAEDDEEEDVDVLDDGPEGSGWSAQVGSFSQRDNAEGLAEEIREQGLEAFLMRHETEDGVVYRVRVGLEDDRDGAVGLAEEVESRTGHAASPVPHP